MNYTYLRYAIIVLFFALGGVLHFQLGLSQSWYLYAAALLLLLSHVLFGNVWLAFSLLKRGKPEQAEKLLRQTWKPEWLFRRNRAYYHFTQGMIRLQQKDLDSGESHLQQAAGLGLGRNNDNALAHLNLAHIHYVQKKMDAARRDLETAKSFDASDLLIKDNIQKLENALQKEGA